MALFTESILNKRRVKDSIRISVMSRHTLPDGVTPDLRITTNKYDLHLTMLAPSPRLVGDYYKRGLPWEEFEQKYLTEIRTKAAKPLVQLLATIALTNNITLLCIEESSGRCHRRLLAEECLRYEPSLILKHL